MYMYIVKNFESKIPDPSKPPFLLGYFSEHFYNNLFLWQALNSYNIF